MLSSCIKVSGVRASCKQHESGGAISCAEACITWRKVEQEIDAIRVAQTKRMERGFA